MSASDALLHFRLTDQEIDLSAFFSTILIVGANSNGTDEITNTLKPLGIELLQAHSAKDALATLETTLVELCFVSLKLPDISGASLISAIQVARPDLPVVAFSGSDTSSDLASAMRAGAWDFFPASNPENLPERVSLTLKNVAERKILKMREFQGIVERNAFWGAVHTATDGLAILGTHGNIVFANSAFKDFVELIGLPCPNLDGTNIINTLRKIDEDLANNLETRLKTWGKGELIWRAEVKIAKPCVLSHVSPAYFEIILNSVGFGGTEEQDIGNIPLELRRFVLWAKDITEKKAKERLERDLLSTTVHDVKGPLGSIIKAADLLSEPGLLSPDKAKTLIINISACARNALTLIDELLSARKIQEGLLRIRPVVTELKEAIDSTLMDFLPSAESKNIKLTSEDISPEFKIYADPTGLKRVLGNLVSNAIKFTPKGGTVSITAARSSNQVRISVSDSGRGIDAKTQRTLFERYSRSRENEQVEGTGLGLYIVKSITDAHGGRIHLESELDRGTTFAVYFPDENPSAPHLG